MTIPTLMIGIGHRYRGDDAFGPMLASHMATLNISGLHCMEHDGEAAGLIECWQGYDRVILVDAVSSGAPAGTLFKFDLSRMPLPASLKLYSTHAFGVAEAVELARVLDQLPRHIKFVGVEGEAFAPGTQLSAQLTTAFESLAQLLLAQTYC